MNSPRVRLVLQLAGRGRLEGHPPGNVDGARFEGRFVIFGAFGENGPLFGEDVSLFDQKVVASHGRGPQSAHLVAVRSGYAMEGFGTGTGDDFPGHVFGRTSSATRLRVFFDPSPDGARSFDDRQSFMKGSLVATYKAEEYFQINPRSGTFVTRVNYSILDSEPFTSNGVTADLGGLFPTMVEHSHGQNPEPDPNPETIPDEEPFVHGGAGTFADRFAVGGTVFASI